MPYLRGHRDEDTDRESRAWECYLHWQTATVVWVPSGDARRVWSGLRSLDVDNVTRLQTTTTVHSRGTVAQQEPFVLTEGDVLHSVSSLGLMRGPRH